MKRMSGKQCHVLENIERVGPLARKLKVRTPFRRYQLDGRDCTAQVTGLKIRHLIEDKQDGSFDRVASVSGASRGEPETS